MRTERFLGECKRRFGFGENNSLEDVLTWMIWADSFVDEARSFLGDDVSDMVTDKADEAEKAYKEGTEDEHRPNSV